MSVAFQHYDWEKISLLKNQCNNLYIYIYIEIKGRHFLT
jgi:hypothetical protein